MTTYYINEENTGLETFEAVEIMAGLMQDDGYDVATTKNFGLINSVECPVGDQEWMDYLEKADTAATEE